MPVLAELTPAPPGSAGTGTAAAKPQGDEAGKDARREIGGPAGPEPTRYGDWEHAGRCIDF